MRNLFLALLVLMITPAFAQEMTYTDPTQIPIADQTYTVIQQQTPTPIEEIKNTGGTALTLYDDGVSNSITLPFDFYYYGNLYDSIFVSQNGFISFTSRANGCCSGNPLPSITQWTEQNAPSFQYINLNNSIFAMWSDLADFNNPGNPYYQAFNDRFVVGWYGINELGSEPYNCDAQGCVPTGPGNKFTYEITLFANNDFMINYGSFDYNNQTGRTFTSGYQGDQTGESYQIYNGNDPSSLQNTTYLVQSSEVTPPPPPPPPPPEEPDPPIAPDCTVNPTDSTCIINSIIDEEPVYLADESTGSDDGSNSAEEDAAVEEMLADTEETFVEEPEALEELLAITDDTAEEDTLEELVASISEMANEEQAVTLSDSISKDTLESALSIVANVEAGSVATTTSESSSSSSSSSRSSNSSAGTSESTVASSDSNSSGSSFDGGSQEQSAAGDASMELLETGRVMGQEALASTMAATEASASDSMSQAENVAQTSSFDSMGSSSATAEIVNSIEIENVIETVIAATESSTDTSMEMMGTSENVTDAGFVSDGSEMFVSIETNPVASSVQEAEEVALAVVNNSIAASEQKTFGDETNTDAEMTNVMVDPALALSNTFNQPPSLMNLEILGIVKPVEEKSDAELRAEQVVAANKEEQDAINANYMEADQSGILAAIGSETDVSAYRTAMLRDNNVWYKPEDIYKGVIIKDNVRGSYFLEKGNTDTYKKMIEEQYKDE